jgi:hypothetical protein
MSTLSLSLTTPGTFRLTNPKPMLLVSTCVCPSLLNPALFVVLSLVNVCIHSSVSESPPSSSGGCREPTVDVQEVHEVRPSL